MSEIIVKPLEWDEQISGEWWIADRYRVEKFDGGGFASRSKGPQSGAFKTLAFGIPFDDAKAAAQSDYEQRILSAIDLEAHKALIAARDAEIERLREYLARTENNRDMWRGQVERQSAKLESLHVTLASLWKESEGAYCRALEGFQKTECLGWEAKARTGVFGKAEFEAHKKGNELIGRHHGIAHAVKEVRAALNASEREG